MFAIVSISVPAAPGLSVLLAVSLKATVILGLAALLTLLLSRASAALRHLVWSAALLGVLVLPVLAIWGPTWSVPGLSLPTFEPAGAVARVAPSPMPEPEPAPGVNREAPQAPAETPKPDIAVSPAPANAPTNPPPQQSAAPVVSWPVVLMTVWAIGAGLCLLWLLVGASMLLRISRRARPLTDPEWQGLLTHCARQLGVRAPVRLWLSERVEVPCAWGLLHPRILIPESAMSWSLDRRRAVLLHELGHIARRDCLVQTLAQIVCALLWFHPLVWVAAWRLRIEREIACDDLVLGADTIATDYADHLLDVVRSLRRRSEVAMGQVAFARRSQLEGRLLAVLDPERQRAALTRGRAVRAALMAALVVLPLAALRPAVQPAMAGRMQFNDSRSRPEDAAASEVVRAPETEVGLTRRLSWAQTQGAKRKDGYWVAYQIPRIDPDFGDLSDTGPLDLKTLDDHWPGARMADVLAGRTMRDPNVAPNPGVMVLAFHFPAGATRADNFDRIRIQSQELTAAFGQQPLFWLGGIEDRESLEWTRTMEPGLRDPELRSVMLDAVALHADEAKVRSHLVGVLSSKAPDEVRASAVERMSRFGDQATVDLLVRTLHDDPSERVRDSAIDALGHMTTPASTRALSKLARDPREPHELRRRAVDALGQKAANAEAQTVLEDLVAAPQGMTAKTVLTSDGPTRVTVNASEGVVALDAKSPTQVTVKQQESKQKVKKQETKVKTETKVSTSSVEEEEIQRQAVQSLSRFPEETSVPRLLKIARTHPNTRVRREAIEVLAHFESPQAREAVLEFAWQHENEEVARTAVDALHGQEGSTPVMIELARRHKLTRVRREAIQILGNNEPTPEALAALDDLVRNDPEEEVQREAVDAFSHMPEEVSLQRLEKIARSHPRAAVRRAAIDALGNLDPDKAVPILESIIGQSGKSTP